MATTRQIICYDLDSGEEVWRSGLGVSTQLSGRKLLADDQYLYVNHSSWIKAFSKATGNVVWTRRFQEFSPILRAKMAQNETHLFLGGHGEVIRVSKDDGTLDLRIPTVQLQPEGVVQLAYDPSVSSDGLLYVPTGYVVEGVPDIQGNLLVYDAESGDYKWGYQAENKKIPIPEYNDTLVVDAGIYRLDLTEEEVILPYGQSVVSLNRHSGEVLWSQFLKTTRLIPR